MTAAPATRPTYVGDGALLDVAESISADWEAIGVRGSFLARNIETGEQLGFDVDASFPIASVVKVPLALTVLDRVARGELESAKPLTVDPARSSVGPTGLAVFQHPATVAVGDLLYLMLAISDNASADALLQLVSPADVDGALRTWGCSGIRVRHELDRMYECAAGVSGNDFGLALELAIRDEQSGRHSIETLDPAHANLGTSAALVDLLERVWLDKIAHGEATAELRRLMGLQVFTQRMCSDLLADTIRISSKTATFLHLRHEIGVVEAESGDRVAVAALTRSNRRARLAPDIDLGIGTAARSAFEALRR